MLPVRISDSDFVFHDKLFLVSFSKLSKAKSFLPFCQIVKNRFCESEIAHFLLWKFSG